jgi:creatinine amidohydrolase
VALIDWPSISSPVASVEEPSIGLIPLGALEQHGPHLPLITDTVIAEHIARRLGEALAPPVVVAPCVPAGLSQHHLAFPGTVTLTAAAFGEVLDAFIAGLERMGVSDVAIFSSHGGNFQFIADFAQRHENQGMQVRGYSDLLRYLATMRKGAARASVNVSEADVHAGGLETSQMLFLRPDLVGSYADVVGYTAAEEGWLETLLQEGAHAVSPNGVLGDPRVATAEAGAAIFDALVEELTDWITEAFDWVKPVVRDAGGVATRGGARR